MKTLLTLLCSTALLFIGCSGEEEGSDQTGQQISTTDAQEEPNRSAAPVDLDPFLGYYVKTAHDGAWLMLLEKKGEGLGGYLVQYEGMLPPVAFLDSEDAEADILKKEVIERFVIDAEKGTFESNLGSGTIAPTTIVFNTIQDNGGPLTLLRDESYQIPK